MINNIKIAVVKLDSYQDLWVCKKTSDILTVIKSTLVRVSPIGLSDIFNTDYIIIKDTNEYPSNIAVKVETTNTTTYSQKIPSLHFLDETFHKDISLESVSLDVDSINWNNYNIVIAINMCIPKRVTGKYPKTLWCYYIGENNDSNVEYIVDGYDIILNQDIQRQSLPYYSIGFPYTLLNSRSLSSLIGYSGNKHGVFMEINNTSERPVVTVPESFQRIGTETTQSIIIHNQNIMTNLHNLCASKYFVKLFGRRIRGNAAMEAISCGTLCLINKSLLMYESLIQDSCNILSETEIINKINYFETHPEEYQKELNEQRRRLDTTYFSEPIKALVREYQKKLELL
jgi:hypothetical protein